jgi:hypothetical protein
MDYETIPFLNRVFMDDSLLQTLDRLYLGISFAILINRLIAEISESISSGGLNGIF